MHGSIEERFGREFRAALCGKFGRLPSAAFVSYRFNAYLGQGCNGVSGETIRRWMRGQSMPSYDHLQALAGWLRLGLERVFQPAAQASVQCCDSPYIDVFAALSPKLQEQVIRFLRCGPMAPQQAKLSGFEGLNAIS